MCPILALNNIEASWEHLTSLMHIKLGSLSRNALAKMYSLASAVLPLIVLQRDRERERKVGRESWI